MTRWSGALFASAMGASLRISSARAFGGSNKDKQIARQPTPQATLKKSFRRPAGSQRSSAIAERIENAGNTDMMYRGYRVSAKLKGTKTRSTQTINNIAV